MKKIKSTSGALLLLLTCCLCNTALAAPESGWWWNPAESGRGYFIESHDGIFFMAAYFYADDGRARWLVSGGNNADPYNYSGRLLEVRNGETLFGSYVAPTAPADSGAISVSFSDDTHGAIVWPGGTIPIVREIFDTNVATFQPESGWWWNPAETGTGYSIEVEGGTLFMVGFMYDDTGNPIWYLSAGPMSTPTTYQGSLLQVAGGQTLAGPYHPPDVPTNVGSLAIAFAAPDTATLTFSGVSAPAGRAEIQAGGSRSIGIEREFKVLPHTYAFPLGYDMSDNYGLFFQSLDTVDVGFISTVQIGVHITGTGLHWTKSGSPTSVVADPSHPLVGSVQQAYVASGGSLEVDAGYTETSPVLNCTGTAPTTHSLFIPFDTHLTVTDMAEYTISIGMQSNALPVRISLTCKDIFGNVTTRSYDPEREIMLIGSGLINGVGLTGKVGPIEVSNGTTRSGRWIFFESR